MLVRLEFESKGQAIPKPARINDFIAGTSGGALVRRAIAKSGSLRQDRFSMPPMLPRHGDKVCSRR
jgi:hypothetical protein